MSFPTMTIAASSAAIVSISLAASTLVQQSAPTLIPQAELLPNLPVDATMQTVEGRHIISLTVPPGLSTATLGLDAGPMHDAIGRISAAPTDLLPGDIFPAGTAEITRAGLPANAPSTFRYQLTTPPNALGDFALWTTAQSEALTASGETRRLRFPTRLVASVRTRLDLDRSGTIDQQDFVAAAALVGAGDPTADLDGDGITSPSDLAVLAEHMGQPAVELNQGFAPPPNSFRGVDPSDAGFNAGDDAPRPFATTMVSGGGFALQNAIIAAADGDTLLVGPGTYTPSNFNLTTLQITKRLTIISTNGAASTFIAAPSGTTGSVAVHMRVSGITLKGFTITGGGFGVLSSDPGGVLTLNNQILSELIITTDSGNPGHGVLFERTTDSRIDEVNIQRAQANGIMLDMNSHRNVVNHCSVLTTQSQHAYAIKNSDYNVVSHCSSTFAFADSLIVLGGYGNVIKDNTFSGHFVDGIVLTDDNPTIGGTGRSSLHNCVLNNVVTSTGFAQSRANGTGIWMNSESNSNLVRGNRVSGHAENGIAIFNADDNVVEGNDVFGNGQGGIIIWDAQASGFVASRGGRPTNNLIRGNDFHTYLSNGAVNIRDADATEIRNNFMRNNANGTGNAGIIIDEPSPPSFTPTAPSTGTLIIGNTLVDLPITLLSRQATTGTKYYQNKHFNTGVTQIFPPAEVDFDGDVTLGGNHWSGFAASGNPSRITPYSDIVVDLIGTRGGPYKDRYPYQSESLSKSYTPTILYPFFYADQSLGFPGRQDPGHVFVEGDRLLIEWKAEAGRFVDITVSSQSTGGFALAVATNIANTGFFLWEIPTGLQRANDYKLTINVKDSAGTTQGTATTGDDLANPANAGGFGIAPAGLTLLTPCDLDKVAQGGTIRIHYNDETNGGAGSDIFYMIRDALAPDNRFNVSINTNTDRNKEYIDISLSSVGEFFGGGGSPILNSNPNGNDPRNPTRFFQVGVSVATGDAFSATDFSDGRMRIQPASTGSAAVGADAIAMSNQTTLLIDACQAVFWFSPVGSEIVDIEIHEGAGYRTIRSGLKDTGSFIFSTPELATNGAKFRITYKTASGVSLGMLETTPIDIVYDTTPGTPKSYFRFYNLVTTQHLYTSLIAERDALNAAVGVWLQEPDQGRIYNGLATVNGVKTVPYYRLFNLVTQRHLWTTDRNEYFTLREVFKDSWVAEGVDGYLLPTQTGAAIPLYRLRFATGLPRQHWTTDLNEYNTLPSRGWVQEGVVGYLLP